ncbi:class I SAM-dependent methyltransferase [Clostridium brassicae]|uniref:Methyltransferase domain-containing protein n=1 Tax=Clostridium brassicae TaxID=2999072 RepID=A0ABT4DB66_9CLOT|nr:class I SAM-dependent methyltransferase [Clostridium brassicae]MCY6959565.1 methyltransferase domain-containing protein [Clostridium brassicae]
MLLNDISKEQIVNAHKDRFKQYGYSPKSLFWDKNRQNIRFDVLTSNYDFSNKKILDIGCGFGDLNNILSLKADRYIYMGIDIVEDFIAYAQDKFKNEENISFKLGDFLSEKFIANYDYIIASGTFNYKLKNMDNYDYIEAIINKSFNTCNSGIAFDFLSDKVDYKYDFNFYYSPEKILSIAYKYSKNIVLRNDYMPFEFSLFINKDDSFKKEYPIFNEYRHSHSIYKKEMY